MKKDYTAKAEVELSANSQEVWNALTNPEEIKKYFFGTNAISDWKVGSPIIFKGEWEGKAYEDKGIIIELIPEKKLVYSYWSAFSGKEDIPENYANITYLLSPQKDGTLLEIQQEGVASEEQKNHSEENWKMVLNQLKELLASKVVSE